MPFRLIFFIVIIHLSTASFAVEKIIINGLFNGKAIVTIDGKQRVLKPGKTSPEGVTLISANSREAVIELDGQQKTYQLGSHIGSSFIPAEKGAIVNIAPDHIGMYFVNGSINGFQVKFLVDTGATLISMNKHHAKRIGINYKLEGQTSSATTASGIVETYLVKLKKVRVGNIELRDVIGSVHDDDFPDVILLGNSFLNRVNLSRDGAMLQLEK